MVTASVLIPAEAVSYDKSQHEAGCHNDDKYDENQDP
jgi:hypothetical protein